jgi:hypothetical protein
MIEDRRPIWTASLIGVVPVLRRFVSDRQTLEPLDTRLIGFLADDLHDDLADYDSVAQFRPKSSASEPASDIRRAVATAANEIDGNDSSSETPEATTRLLKNLEVELRSLPTKDPMRVGANEERLLRILDRVCDHLYGAQPVRAS